MRSIPGIRRPAQPRNTRRHRRTWAAPTAAALAAALLVGCTGSSGSAAGTASATGGVRPTIGPSGPGAAQAGRTAVRLPGSTATIAIAMPPLDAEQRTPLVRWGDLPVVVGVPAEVTLDGPLPASGVTITRTYAAALPEDTTATLAYFDPVLATWLAVPSTVSADRRLVSATVHHLSLWTDIVSGEQKAVKAVKETAAALSVRVS